MLAVMFRYVNKQYGKPKESSLPLISVLVFYHSPQS